MSTRIKIRSSSGRAGGKSDPKALQVNNYWWNNVPIISDVISAVSGSQCSPASKSNQGARNDAWKLSDEM